jgi:hypothetical protein
MELDLVIKRFEEVRSTRGNFESVWQQIGDRVLPQAADFNTKRADGERRTELMFDATAALAAQKAVAAISTFVWPPNQRYQRLATSNKDLNKSQAVKVYMDALTDTLFQARYSPRASFEAQMGEAALQAFVFGTGLMFVDDDMKARTLRYKSMHLAQTYILENAAGRVDTVYRCWPWSLRQINQKFPDKLPPKLQERMKTRPDEVADVCHVVMPREDYKPDGLGYQAWEWASLYFLPSEKWPLEMSGFHSWPFAIMRYMTSPGEVYGRSPAWMALSDIKVLNAQKKTLLQAAQKVVDPPLLLPEDGVLQAFSLAPGSLNYGGVDDQGRQLVHPLVSNARIDIGLDMMDKEREIIASAFLLDVFRVLVEHPDMTATQTLELLQERATLLSPIGGRIESEALGPMTEREISLLTHAGKLPPMPPEMIEAQGEYRIEYTSPMRQAMRASDGIAITRTFAAVLPLAEKDPSVLDAFDVAGAARELAEINGMPAKLLRDPDAIKQIQQSRESAQQAQQMVDAAPALSSAAVNLTKLQAAGGRPQI